MTRLLCIVFIVLGTGILFDFDPGVTLYDLDRALYDVTAGALMAQSASRTDNTEHLWEALTPGHIYKIRIVPAPQANALNRLFKTKAIQEL
jgi:hypothetical protein